MGVVIGRNGDDLRIGHLDGGGTIILTGAVDNDDAARIADLRGGESDAVRRVHGFQHIVHEGSHGIVDMIDGLGFDLQARIRRNYDGHQGHAARGSVR